MDIVVIASAVRAAVNSYNLNSPQDEQIVNNLVFSNIDSLALTSLVIGIEDELKKRSITIDLSEITQQNFESLGTIIHYIWTTIIKPVKKLVVVDLDNTLWDGIVGDDADILPNIELQRNLLTLKDKGILLAIISKNEFEVVSQAFSREDMILSMDDFIAVQINWLPKSLNMQNILVDLNLGPEAVIFIDDSIEERTIVQECFPEIMVRDTLHLPDIQLTSSTYEDVHRLQMYKDEKLRQKLKNAHESMNKWIKMLELSITKSDHVSTDAFPRVLQLLNKSNQMNSCTRRFTEASLLEELNKDTFHMWPFEIKDKFGNMGITAILGFVVSLDAITITDFVLSCRVMGRQVEDCMIYMLINFVKELYVPMINILYYPTSKNIPMGAYLKSKNFTVVDNTFQYCIESNTWKRPNGILLNA